MKKIQPGTFGFLLTSTLFFGLFFSQPAWPQDMRHGEEFDDTRKLTTETPESPIADEVKKPIIDPEAEKAFENRLENKIGTSGTLNTEDEVRSYLNSKGISDEEINQTLDQYGITYEQAKGFVENTGVSPTQIDAIVNQLQEFKLEKQDQGTSSSAREISGSQESASDPTPLELDEMTAADQTISEIAGVALADPYSFSSSEPSYPKPASEMSLLEVIIYGLLDIVKAVFKVIFSPEFWQNVGQAVREIWSYITQAFSSAIQNGSPLPVVETGVTQSFDSASADMLGSIEEDPKITNSDILATAPDEDQVIPGMESRVKRQRRQQIQSLKARFKTQDQLPRLGFPIRSGKMFCKVLHDRLKPTQKPNQYTHELKVQISNLRKGQKFRVFSWYKKRKSQTKGILVGASNVVAKDTSIILKYNYPVFFSKFSPQNRNIKFTWGIDIPRSVKTVKKSVQRRSNQTIFRSKVQPQNKRKIFITPGRLVPISHSNSSPSWKTNPGKKHPSPYAKKKRVSSHRRTRD